jgi:hypothetical protein
MFPAWLAVIQLIDSLYRNFGTTVITIPIVPSLCMSRKFKASYKVTGGYTNNVIDNGFN